MKRALIAVTLFFAFVTVGTAQQFEAVQAEQAPLFTSVDLLAKCTKRFLDGDASQLVEATQRGEAMIVPRGTLCTVSVTPEGFVAAVLQGSNKTWYTYKSVFGL